MKIMKKYLLLASALAVMVGCADDNYVGDNGPTSIEDGSNAINFGLSLQKTTRADIMGPAAADILGNNFYVMGTKGTEAATSPTPTKVFDNYLVHYYDNTASTTPSNTANWEYVGIYQDPELPATPTVPNYPKLSSITGAQTIKYWDYSTDQYDFFAFSTGKKTPVVSTSPTDAQVGVTSMNFGESLKDGGVAYTFTIPSEEALKEVYITDITEVLKANYGKEVSLKFKNLGSKIRIALYETVPGYSVSDIKFYSTDAADVPTDLASATKGTEATLISTSSIPTSGTIAVSFPHVGVNHSPEATSPNTSKEDYNKAAVNVTAGSTSVTSHGFGTLNYTGKENAEAAGDYYLGRSLTTATFAGSSAAQYYTTVFPVSSSYALTLRVDYTLTATDGSGETIKVYGAKASVPATYTVWRPNYAYTYIFKISDATNGWTTTAATTENKGLYPITFDAVVAEATDITKEQTTITTVSTPSITTYQQNHDNTKNEYSKATAKDIYVQVMNTAVSPATLITGLTATNSLVYELSDANATEAKVLDALTMRTTAVSTDNVTGRNGLVLTKGTVDNTVTSIVNGVDDQPITHINNGTSTPTAITSGMVGKIAISGLTAGKSYAYVYIPTASTVETPRYEFVPTTAGSPISSSSTASSETYYPLDKSDITGGAELSAAEAPATGFLYFTKTSNGTGTTTYSYISPIGKTSIPKGCIKVAVSELGAGVAGNTNASTDTFYFDKYITNNGAYAVKVIKVVD